ncbi:retrotransposon protein, putative, ty1-copia subclass [Tanacetum coccineum]
MQEKLKLSKSQGASTPAEKQRMQNIPYASAIGSIMYAVRYAEYITAFDASKEAVPTKLILSQDAYGYPTLDHLLMDPVILKCRKMVEKSSLDLRCKQVLVCEAASTTLVVNKKDLSSLEIAKENHWALSRFNQIMNGPFPKENFTLASRGSQSGAPTFLKWKKKGYIDNLERLGQPVGQNLAVSLILVSLNKDFTSFVQNFNMHGMGKTVNELHAMLKLHEESLPKKDANPALHAIRAGRVQKNQKNKPHKAGKGGQGKGKNKMGYAHNNVPFAPKPKTPPPPKKDNPAKDAICHQCGEVGHWRRNCPVYLAELMKKKKLSQGASASGIFTIELYSFPSKSWIYDTGCGTHICITTQGLRGSKKLKPGALSLYVGDGHRAAVEAIGTYHLELPSGLVIVLNNCHYAPSITRGVISVSRLFDDGFINRFDDNNVISVSKNNLVYFMAVPRDGIFEIDMSCSNTNDSSMYAITNKRAKINLDSSLLWHCRLGHISKKRIEKLQHDGLLNSIDIESLGKCVSCLSGKMARKPYSHQVERAKDLLGLIHTDVCGPFRIVSRQGASYFVTFTDDFSRYGYVYLLKHKHEVFETFKVFQKEVENQLGKTIKSLRSDRGGEYMSQEFLDHLKEHGIIAHRTPPYTPQNNGVSERRNRTLLDMVRSMMSQTTLPKSFWDYALETAARILNMVPTKKVDKTPYEIWHGQAPKLSYLKVWGCEALVKRDTLTKPDKLDPRSFRCIFGFNANPNASIAAVVGEEQAGFTQSSRSFKAWCLQQIHSSRNTRVFHNSIQIQKRGKLKRSIYGTPLSSSRQWNKRFDDEIKKFGFTQNPDEPCVYLKASGSYVAILILYVDDILLMGNNISMLQDVKSYLGRSFAMKDLGDAAYILGIKIYRDRSKRLIEKLKLSKSQGASTPAEKQRMQNIPYASAIGSIMYAVRCTRPDVAFAQNMTSRFQQNPGEEHWTAVKNILKYLRNTKDMFLVYGGNLKRQLRVSCYTDAGYLTDADNLKSQTGYVFILNGGAVDRKSTKQSIFATSSTVAEYIAAFDASKEAVWIRKFISGLGIVPTIEEPISMYCDNTGAIAIAKDDGVTKGARHFRAKVHYLRETIKMGDVKIEKIDTDDNLADPFTKALAFPKHSELTRNIGLLPASSFM